MKEQYRLVENNDDDCQLSYMWWNDETTRKMSFNQSATTSYDEFRLFFKDKYFSNHVQPIYVCDESRPMCFIGFMSLKDTDAQLIGINMDPEYRGKHLGKHCLAIGIAYIKDKYPNVKKIHAEIKECNMPSIKVFEAFEFGYQLVDIYEKMDTKY